MNIEKIELHHSSNGYPTLAFHLDRKVKHSNYRYGKFSLNGNWPLEIAFTGLYWVIRDFHSKIEYSSDRLYQSELQEKFVSVELHHYSNVWNGLFQRSLVEKTIKALNYPLSISVRNCITWNGPQYPFLREAYNDCKILPQVYQDGMFWAAKTWYKKSLNNHFIEINLGNLFVTKQDAIDAINYFSDTGLVKQWSSKERRYVIP